VAWRHGNGFLIGSFRAARQQLVTIAERVARLGTVEASDEHEAIQRVARERDIPAAWLIAQRR
jgi:hypothetical protein